MTCRHSKDDPNCSSHSYSESPTVYTSYGISSIDNTKYSIIDIERVAKHHVVMKVKYDSCLGCEFEGNKVLVFLNVSERDIVLWKKIDPHFRDNKKKPAANEAPSPAARFPPTDKGWVDAVMFATAQKPTP